MSDGVVHSPAPARSRLILLGASNLTRGFPLIVDSARRLFGSPLEIIAALGHGRSYGMRSSIMLGARALPGILECGVWEALRPGEHARSDDARLQTTFALITDIGNDIVYGAPPQEIGAWIETCVERLQDQHAQIAMTMIPIVAIRKVKRWQFHIVRTMLFPTRRITYEQAIGKAEELAEVINDIAQRRGITLVQPQAQWYGFDPIHVRRRHWPEAWGEALGACINRMGEQCEIGRSSIVQSFRYSTMMPEQYWLFGRKRTREQPTGRLADGTTISLY